MTISGTEPSWMMAERQAAQQAEADRRQQARDLEDVAAEARAREYATWKHPAWWLVMFFPDPQLLFAMANLIFLLLVVDYD